MAEFDAVVSLVRPLVAGCPDSYIEQRVRDTVRDFCTRSTLLREAVSFDTEPSVAAYGLYPDSALEPMLVLTVTVDGQEIAPNHSAVVREATGTPYRFYYAGGDLLLWPTPDAVVPVTANLVVAPRRDADSYSPRLLNDWAEPLASGAAARLLSMPGHPWADTAGFKLHYSLYEQGIVAARRQASGRVFAPDLQVKPNPFF